MLDVDGDLVAEYIQDCQPVRVDYTVSPTLTATIDADDSANCGDVTASLYDAGGVMCVGTEMTVSCANDGDPTDITLADNGCGPYTISGGACTGCTMPMCSITPDPAANIVCDDNGTPADPSDDTFTFDITVNGSNTDPAASNTFSDDQGNAGIAYGTTLSYGPFPIAGGNVIVSFTDADDAACTGMMMGTAPAPCSNAMCSISASVMTSCDDAGTPEDDSDDITTYTVTVTGTNAGATFTDDQGNAGVMYGTPIIYTVMGTAGLNVTYMDDGDAACTTSAIEFSGCAVVENIPTVGEWGLIILGLMMSITAIVGIRARREEEATA